MTSERQEATRVTVNGFSGTCRELKVSASEIRVGSGG